MNYVFLIIFSFALVTAYPQRRISLAEYKSMTLGLYKGFEVRGNIRFWMQCWRNYLDEANDNLEIAIREIQEVKPTKILSLFRGLQHYKNYVAVTIYDCRPCASLDRDPELQRLWNLIETVNWQNVLRNLSTRFNLIMDNFVETREYWNKQDMENYGKSIAILLRTCFAN
eukprot:TRINITY_DN1748_c0_g1_i3.p1 TRINITY_DN1748_c0_g1~~TRINITY_DN1748_c0_g1_i3.p1  ORF type:complete len:170 (+),score=40.76 TRINITY_DN1748_c0_g1_i3:210-719(+)